MSSQTVVEAGWAALAAALVVCGILPLVARGRFATLFELTRRLTPSRPVLAAVYLGWLWIGWHFFAR